MSTTDPTRDVQQLLSVDQYTGVVRTVLDNNPGMTEEMAHRITDEALKFVATAAQFRTARIAPSRVVDEGWHALILHTAVYAALCERLGGFVHHYPERPNPDRFDAAVIDRTMALIEEVGYTPDRVLWGAPTGRTVSVAADCQHSGGTNCGPIVPIPNPKTAGTPV